MADERIGQIRLWVSRGFGGTAHTDLAYLLSEYDRQDAVLSKVIELYERAAATEPVSEDLDLFLADLSHVLEGSPDYDPVGGERS